MDQPKGTRSVRHEDLDAALAGHDAPQSLYAPDCKERLGRMLSELVSDLGGVKLEETIPRYIIEELISRPDVGLAIVEGHGGTGKTVSVLRALYDMINSEDRLVGALMPGPNPPQKSLPELVASWRSSKILLQAEGLDSSIERLRIANASIGRPILVLALDGLDESRWQESYRRDVEELITYFFRLHQKSEPEAMLVVTCRTRRDIDDMLVPDGTGGHERRAPEVVDLGNFTTDELSKAWRLWFDDEPCPELDNRTIGSETLYGPSPGDEVAFHFKHALLHPVLLGCVKKLGRKDREDLLNGAEAAWHMLIEHYVDWFTAKVVKRRSCKRQNVIRALQAASRSCTVSQVGTVTYDRQQHWVDPGCAETGLNRSILLDIFEDAVTSGLITADGLPPFRIPVRDPVKWKWHFDFIPKHLIRLP